MIQGFRKFLSSKIGLVVAFFFLGLIALAFAAMDISDSATFGGVSGGDRVAIVGKTKISTSDLSTAVRNEFNQYRQNDPTATLEEFIAEGGLDRVLDNLLDRTAIAEFGRKYGLRAGNRLVDSEIVKIPAFSGPDGRFSQDVYRAALAQQGLSDRVVRDDLQSGLLARQVMLPVLTEGRLPQPLVKRYAALLRERRTGSIGLLLSDAYAPSGDPTDAQLQSFYNDNRAAYMRPERRVIRYVTFGDEALGDVAAPTEEEIAARYQRDIAQYSATERRTVSQLVVPTEAAATAIRDEVAAGKSLDAAAREKGLAVSRVGPVTQEQLASETSAAVAQAAFTGQQGQLAATARAGLGFYVVRVDAIERTAGRTLAQARGEISAALAIEKRNAALADLSSQIEERLDGGASLAEVAREIGAAVQTTPQVLANGGVYQRPGETAPEVLAPALSAAFDMDEGQPQLAVLVPGEMFLVFDVSQITPAAAAPLAEIREIVIRAWRRAEGDKLAKEAADRVMTRVAGGASVAAAMAAEAVTLPPPDAVNMNREELGRLGPGGVPPVLALMFSMAEGTVKRLEAPSDNGWFVVKLDEIEASPLADDDPLIARSSQQLGQAQIEEYARQFLRAISNEIGVDRNATAINAVRNQLTGQNR